ncbi:MAG: LysR substrate-binding domain-containing protein [Candidatus Acidiferrales bacterium]
MYPGVELRLLRYVIAVAEELNFTRASARLHVAQPPLSKQIRQLEQYLGVELFERTKREVKLTSAGHAFLRDARKAIFHAQRAVEVARAAKDELSGLFAVSYSPLIDLRIVSKVRQYFSTSHPTAEVTLLSAHSSEQSDRLLHGTLLAGLVILPVMTPELAFESLVREPLLLALPENHELARRDLLTAIDLDNTSLVKIRGDIEPRFREALSQILKDLRVRPRIIHEATTQAEAIELALEGGFAALTMQSARTLAREGIIFRELVESFLTAETGIAYLPGNGSPILRSLRLFLTNTFKPLSGTDPNDVGSHRKRQMKLF